MSEPVWTEWDWGYTDATTEPWTEFREWPPVSDKYVKVVEGEVIEEGQSPPMLERGEVAVSPEEGRSSRASDGTSAENASNLSVPVPLLRRLALDEAGAKNE